MKGDLMEMRQYLIERAELIKAKRRARIKHALSGFAILAVIVLNAFAVSKGI